MKTVDSEVTTSNRLIIGERIQHCNTDTCICEYINGLGAIKNKNIKGKKCKLSYLQVR
jgi:hypothetical protein